jgi:aspartyl-tRNA(Asn)/glutamyl-tRNA(Gln) amidotransferase subunit C
MEIKDVEKLMELARLDLSEEEKKAMLKDLDSVIAYVKAVQEVKTDDIEPNLSVRNAWREDQHGVPPFSRDLIIGQFPESQDGFLKVKKIL